RGSNRRAPSGTRSVAAAAGGSPPSRRRRCRLIAAVHHVSSYVGLRPTPRLGRSRGPFAPLRSLAALSRASIRARRLTFPPHLLLFDIANLREPPNIPRLAHRRRQPSCHHGARLVRPHAPRPE